jgi:hypothetical protein
MRADAQQNHDRLPAFAAEAFAAHGTGTSLKAVARSAGVGIGTLYRRFAITTLLAAGAGRPGTDADEVLMSLGRSRARSSSASRRAG